MNGIGDLHCGVDAGTNTQYGGACGVGAEGDGVLEEGGDHTQGFETQEDLGVQFGHGVCLLNGPKGEGSDAGARHLPARPAPMSQGRQEPGSARKPHAPTDRTR